MATYENNNKTPATGVTGTVLGGTALAVATGLLNGGLGGLFGGGNPEASAVYMLSKKDTEIAQLRAEKHADDRFFELSERMSAVEARVLTIEKTEPLRDQMLSERILSLQATLGSFTTTMVKDSSIAVPASAA